MRLSIVTTMYRSAPFLAEFHERITASARRAGVDAEFVYVNDGSPDDDLERVLRLRQQHANVRVVDLSRNFGHHAAIMTGLAHATGERIFLIDCDLEEAPELLEQFLARMDQVGADVIYGVQTVRRDGWLNRVLAAAYYRVINGLCDETIPENLTTVRLLTRRYVDALLRHGEVNFVLASLSANTGFEQVAFPVEKGCKSSTTYTMGRKFKILFRHVTSASSRPLYFIFVLGVAMFSLSALAAVGLLVRRLMSDMQVGWASLMISIWFLGGLILLCQGVIGIYLSQVYVEVKRRPRTIVRDVFEPTTRSDHEQLARAG